MGRGVAAADDDAEIGAHLAAAAIHAVAANALLLLEYLLSPGGIARDTGSTAACATTGSREKLTLSHIFSLLGGRGETGGNGNFSIQRVSIAAEAAMVKRLTLSMVLLAGWSSPAI